ncbi:DUF6583 family protein [Virgibacillus salexigens]|uniref:DUF6583 family protein n=1 Tax=Virgibacillus salexigens TaxID=61016 RepID=UPI003081D207
MGETRRGKLSPKTLIAIVIGAVILIGGSVSAFIFSNLSGKQEYFLAEKNSIEVLTEKFEERYEPEMSWLEQTEENPTESTVELSAEYNNPNGSAGYGQMDPSQFINNSTITMKNTTDMENKKLSSELTADIGGIQIDGLQFYLTGEKLMVGLPFIEDLLSVKGNDIGSLLHELDPSSFTGEEKVDFASFFEGSLSEEDLDYFKEAYGEMIYNEIPEDAFKAQEETIKVNDQSLDTEKVTMQLSENEVKQILTTILDKLEKDEKVKEILSQQMKLQQLGGTAMNSEMEQMITDFETGLADAKEALTDLQIPNGLTSTIWIHDDVIAQRDFQVQMGPSSEELVTLAVKGTQLLKEDSQVFNYDVTFEDSVDQGKMNLAGDLSWKDNKATDSINLTIGDIVLSYNGTETLDDNKREFERTFSIEDPANGGGSLLWNGSSTYNNDQMNAEHDFSLETATLSQEMASLHAGVSGKTVDSVKIPEGNSEKDLGNMNAEQLMQYFETDVTPKFQQWFFGKLSESGNMGF